jgi:hypothetical protein
MLKIYDWKVKEGFLDLKQALKEQESANLTAH